MKNVRQDVLIVHTPDGETKEVKLGNYAIVGTEADGKVFSTICVNGSITDVIEIYTLLHLRARELENVNPLVKECFDSMKKCGDLENFKMDSLYHLEKITRRPNSDSDELFKK